MRRAGRPGWASALSIATLVFATTVGSGCATQTVAERRIEVTAYCPCSKCTGWERGSWRYLKLDFWNKYVRYGPNRGRKYSGRTASGAKPRQQRPGLFSADTFVRPWMLPVRLVFPWLWFPRDGTVAADTRYYPFGTRVYVPGYGYGVVEDRGGAIKGPRRLDVYYRRHGRALEFGRRNVPVEILD